jgi:hypothetical protein
LKEKPQKNIQECNVSLKLFSSTYVQMYLTWFAYFWPQVLQICVYGPIHYSYAFIILVLQVSVSHPTYFRYVFLIQRITSMCFLSNVLQVCVSYPMYYRCTFVSDPTNYVFQFYMPYPIYHNYAFLIIRFNLQLCVTGIISNLKVK